MEGYSQQLKDQSRALSRYSKDKNILEVGFNAGHSSETFLLSNDVSNITSVDRRTLLLQDRLLFFEEKFSNRIKLIVEDSLTALEKLNESGNVYDLIFVDGNHSYEYAKKDLLNSRNLSDKNTIILMDDVNGQDVKRAWNELIQDKLLEEIEIIEFDLTQNVRYVRAMGAGRFLFDENSEQKIKKVVIIPTYNESENIKFLLDKLVDLNLNCLIIDDDSRRYR